MTHSPHTKVGRLRVTPLTPLIVHGGITAPAFELRVTEESGRKVVQVLDLDGFVRDASIPEEKRRNFAVREVDHIRRVLPLRAEGALGRETDLETFPTTIEGIPYLPGSNLKGALRTAMLWARSQDDTVRRHAHATREGRPRFFAGDLERDCLGPTPNADLFRRLLVGDGDPIDVTRLTAQEMRVLRWTTKGFDDRRTPILSEAVPAEPPVSWSHRIVFDAYPTPEQALRANRRLALAPDPRGHLAGVAELLGAVAPFAEAVLEAERRFYGTVGCDGAAQVCRDLLERVRSGAVLVPLGAGTGWTAKTMGARLRPKERRDLLARFEAETREGRKYNRIRRGGTAHLCPRHSAPLVAPPARPVEPRRRPPRDFTVMGPSPLAPRPAEQGSQRPREGPAFYCPKCQSVVSREDALPLFPKSRHLCAMPDGRLVPPGWVLLEEER